MATENTFCFTYLSRNRILISDRRAIYLSRKCVRRPRDVTRLSSYYRPYYDSCAIKTELSQVTYFNYACYSLSEFQTLVNTNKGTSNRIITTIMNSRSADSLQDFTV